MSTVYSRSMFGLNAMRWQDDEGLNLKPFEITLSGACLLQSYRGGIEELFAEDECVVFRSLPECRSKVTRLLEAPDALRIMTEKGRDRSLKDHCWKNRAEAVLQIIGNQGARQ